MFWIWTLEIGMLVPTVNAMWKDNSWELTVFIFFVLFHLKFFLGSQVWQDPMPYHLASWYILVVGLASHLEVDGTDHCMFHPRFTMANHPWRWMASGPSFLFWCTTSLLLPQNNVFWTLWWFGQAVVVSVFLIWRYWKISTSIWIHWVCSDADSPWL